MADIKVIESERSINQIFNVDKVRDDFPILKEKINGKPLVYLDNAATTQKPLAVIEAITQYYLHDNANVHRGVHALSDRATEAFEQARSCVARFIKSPSTDQIIWTRGTTEAINLVASSFGRQYLNEGDVILLPTFEHHSNIVPWQMIAAEKNAIVKPIQLKSDGTINFEDLDAQLNEQVKIVAFNHVSNALGNVNPVKEIIKRARAVGAYTLVDGAQAISHFDIDVIDLECDFYCFSGHKLYGPTGIGVLWGKQNLLEAMPPYQGGGEMIETVRFDHTTYNQLPYKFEAGTPDIAGAVGFAGAINYLNQFDRSALMAHERGLLDYARQCGGEDETLLSYGDGTSHAGVYSFNLKGIHPGDIGTLIDQQGIAVRTGHHCTQPLMDSFDVPGTVRASFAMYNTLDEIDRLFDAIQKAKRFLI